MTRLALDTLRWRWASVTGAFVALTSAMAIVGAIGILGETGLRGSDGPVERYAAAPIVVAASQSLVFGEDDEQETLRLLERAGVPLEAVERVAMVPGVADVIADVAAPAIVASADGNALTANGGPPLVLGWSSSALTPFALSAGELPTTDDTVVLDADLAAAHSVAIGDTVVLMFATDVRVMTVTGIAEAPPGYAGRPPVFISDALAATASDGSSVNALGVMLDEGANPGAVAEAVRAAAGEGLHVYTGAERAKAEWPEYAVQNSDLVELSAAVGGLTVVLAIIVVVSILGLGVERRLHEVALLRTIGATPGQVRRLVVGEALIIAAVAGLAGIAPAIAVARYLFGELQARGVGAPDTTLQVGVLPLAGAFAVTLVTAVVASWLASRRAAKVRPTVALTERSSAQRPGWLRLIIGLAALAGMMVLAKVAFAQSGIAAAEASAGVLVTGLVAAGFLARSVGWLATGIIGRLIERISRTTGFLAMAHARAQSRRMSTVVALIAVVVGLTVTLIGTVTVPMHATVEQTRERLIADQVVHGAYGIPSTFDEQLRRTAGVSAVTRITETSMALHYSSLGESAFEFFPAAAITSNGLEATLKLDVRAGSLDDLGPGDAAISEDVARLTGSRVGDRLQVWLADGTASELRVTAVFARPWGLGEVLVTHETLRGHAEKPLNGYLLVAFDEGVDPQQVEAVIASAGGGLPGITVMDPGAWEAGVLDAAEADAWINYMILTVLGLFCAIAAVNALVLATNDRAGDFALLRMAGATRGQVLRMVRWETCLTIGLGLALGLGVAALTLVPFSQGFAETAVPALPWFAVCAIVSLTVALGILGAELPARRILERGRESHSARAR